MEPCTSTPSPAGVEYLWVPVLLQLLTSQTIIAADWPVAAALSSSEKLKGSANSESTDPQRGSIHGPPRYRCCCDAVMLSSNTRART